MVSQHVFLIAVAMVVAVRIDATETQANAVYPKLPVPFPAKRANHAWSAGAFGWMANAKPITIVSREGPAIAVNA